jgi:redox-sensitive bicupin YhaK (pirin superfamily)
MTDFKAPELTLPRLTALAGVPLRTVSSLTVAPSSFEGEGFPVRRAFWGIPDRDLDPFIHMDQMGEVNYLPGEPKGTPWHPHRGFETFTYLLEGRFQHQDSNGGGGLISEGGTQYMTAGDGILHIETPPEELVVSGGLFHGVQLWINLPRSLKRIQPQYQDLQGPDSTLVSSPDGGALIRVLAGSLGEHAGPGISHTPLVTTHVTVSPGAEVDIPWRDDFNALAYVLAGSGTISGSPVEVSVGNTAVLTGPGAVRLRAHKAAPLEVFLIGGVPLREPVAKYGPFVMSDRRELQEAVDDYRAGRLGVIPADAIQPFRVN